MRRMAMMAAALTLAVAPLRAQSPMERADAHFQAERWAEAAEAYEAVLDADSTAAMAWYRLGRVRAAQGRHTDALALFDAAGRHGFQPVSLEMARAHSHSALGHTDAALDALEAAAEEGLPVLAPLEDSAFAALAGESRFQEITEKVRRNAEPCRHSPEARQLDFWVGTWDVHHPETGQRLGENVIEPMLKDCALMENWTGGSGSSGKSLNFYDPQRKTWRQVWVSDRGNVLDYRDGAFSDGAMRFQGITLSESGDTTWQRLTFVDVAPDTVRQVFEASRDGGATWDTTWVGVYVRRR
jgi:hypothetical protein